MKITSLTLRDFIKLRLSNIKEININTEADNIQLIIGSNGSGKSSTMHELFPSPSIRSSFKKTGYKELCIRHNNSDYRMTYTPSDGHTFFYNETNLNISGTNEIQKDLIKEHLGITSDIHTILKCSLPICEMIPSQRKKVLMNMNPIDISIFLEKYQKVHKDVVAYSNNLDRLYDRQKQLMMQKIPEEQYKEMLEHKQVLEDQEKILLIWMTNVTNELDKFILPSTETLLPNNIHLSLRKLFLELPRFSEIRRRDWEVTKSTCLTKTEMFTSEILELEKTLEETVDALNDYENKRALVVKDGSNVAEELSNLLIRLGNFDFKEESSRSYLSEDRIANAIKIGEQINTLLTELSYLDGTLLNREEVSALYKRVIDGQAEINSSSSDLARYVNQYEELKQSLRIYNTAEDCKLERCELFNIYKTNLDSKQDKLLELYSDIEKLKERVTTLNLLLGELRDQYDNQLRAWEYLNQVLVLIRNESSLSSYFPEAHVIKRIQESPLLLIRDISNYITKSEKYNEYVSLKKKIKELEDVNSSLSSKKQLSLEIIDTEISRYTNQLVALRTKYSQKQEIVKAITNEHKLLHDFSNLKEEATLLANQVELAKEYTSIKASRDYLNNLYSILDTLLKKVRIELIDITNICREQDTLIVRIDKEVDGVIAELKPKYDNSKQIEQSLYKLPIKYTVSFVNSIIETANYFINEITTYPMYLAPVKEEDEEQYDFSFPVLINNEVTKDISLCSDGQKIIIQLAFNLAMVVELKFNDYPIYCDEMDRAMDNAHSTRLTELISNLINQGVVSQVFVSCHHPIMIDKFTNSGNITVLNSDNIILPQTYNVNTKITYN